MGTCGGCTIVTGRLPRRAERGTKQPQSSHARPLEQQVDQRTRRPSLREALLIALEPRVHDASTATRKLGRPPLWDG